MYLSTRAGNKSVYLSTRGFEPLLFRACVCVLVAHNNALALVARCCFQHGPEPCALDRSAISTGLREEGYAHRRVYVKPELGFGAKEMKNKQDHTTWHRERPRNESKRLPNDAHARQRACASDTHAFVARIRRKKTHVQTKQGPSA